MTTLFELTGDALRLQRQINAAAELLFSDDPAEVAGAVATLEGLISAEADNRHAILSKADTWCWVIDHLRAQAATRVAHSKRLAELAIAAEQRANTLQDRLISVLQRIDPDATRWELPDHKLSSRKASYHPAEGTIPFTTRRQVNATTSFNSSSNNNFNNSSNNNH